MAKITVEVGFTNENGIAKEAMLYIGSTCIGMYSCDEVFEIVRRAVNFIEEDIYKYISLVMSNSDYYKLIITKRHMYVVDVLELTTRVV